MSKTATLSPPVPLWDIRDPANYRLWTTDHVRFCDLDALGHANNLAIATYFENARIGLHHAVTPGWPNVAEVFLMVHAAFDYFAELQFQDEVRIGTRIVKFGTSSMHIAGILLRGDRLAATAQTVSVLIDPATRRPREIPAALRQRFLAATES